MTKDEEIAKRLAHMELELKRVQKDLKAVASESKKLHEDIKDLTGVLKTYIELMGEE